MERHSLLSTGQVNTVMRQANVRFCNLFTDDKLLLETGKRVYTASFGKRSLDGSDRLTPGTTWIASQTEMATSVAVIQVI
jgi:hypothetical protein